MAEIEIKKTLNPVLIALDKDILRFKNSVASGSAKEKSTSTHVSRLCTLWNTYEGRIKEHVFAEKVLQLGDFICSLGYHNLSADYCYGRYLYSKFRFTLDHLETAKEDNLLSFFFPPDEDGTCVINTIRALIGYSSGASKALLISDPKFQDSDTGDRIAKLLGLLQMGMEVGLKRDSHCWLVYNATIHTYTIARALMKHARSHHVLRPLIWACVCMESSVPLLTLKYFNWRCQLYTITCQCYFDLKADADAEKFAQRGLLKLEELRDIESISCSSIPTPETAFMFSEASVKLHLMVFKRQVYETKRRAKNALRSKIKTVLKDILNNQWPRTGTERLLADMFRSRSAQLLAVVETLSNSNRRLIQSGPGGIENDDISDAYAELFFAGVELCGGGGGPKPPTPGKHEYPLCDVVHGISMLHLAASDSGAISLDSVVQLLKLAFNYENWDTFDVLLEPVLEELSKHPDDQVCVMNMSLVNLLSAMSTINQTRVRKRLTAIAKTEEIDTALASQKHKTEHAENLLKTALLVDHYISSDEGTMGLVTNYHDVLIDIVLVLWNKCRRHFARVTSVTSDTHKYPDHLRWIKILLTSQKLMVNLGINDIDVCACAEASLKLAVLLESIIHSSLNPSREHSGIPLVKTSAFHIDTSHKSKSPDEEMQELESAGSFHEICEFLNIEEKTSCLLEYIADMLHTSLRSIDIGRDNLLKLRCGISDTSAEDCISSDDVVKEEAATGSSGVADTYTLNMESYHSETLYQYYYVVNLLQTLKIPMASPTIVKKKASPHQRRSTGCGRMEEEGTKYPTGIELCGKNDLFKALFLTAAVEVAGKLKQKQNGQLIEEAYSYIQKAIQAEARMKSDNAAKSSPTKESTVPPPPRLIHRGSSTMVFKPAPFVPAGGEKIRWYSLCLRNAAGNNVKVRLNDTKYPGTGEELPFTNNCTFTVRGLEPNERYVAAIAAYDEKGQLIGGKIGESGRPFIASHILPCLLSYGKLCRVAYNNNYWKLSKMTSNILWQHYVKVDVEEGKRSSSNIRTPSKPQDLIPYKLKEKNIEHSSVAMLHYFVESIFTSVDISTKEQSLYCDALCEGGGLVESQLARMNECSKLLIGVEVAGWLNDQMLCLQSVVLTYSLLTPIMHWKLPILSVLKLLLHMHTLLQQIQSIFKNKKQSSATDCLRHMVSCLAYYTANILVYFGKKHEAIDVLEVSCKLVSQLNNPEAFKSKVHALTDDDTASTLSGKKNKKLKKRTKGGAVKSQGDSQPGVLMEIRALELYTLRLQREVAVDCSNELTGNEDVTVMNAVVSSLPVPLAYKEVVKFKRRAQFFEAFVGILNRALKDGSYETVLEWVKETVVWLSKRNEIILNKTAPDTKGVVVVASNEVDRLKRYSTAVVEYGRTSATSTQKDTAAASEHKKSELVVGSVSSKPSLNAGGVGSKQQMSDGNTSKVQMPMITEEKSDGGNSVSTTHKGGTHANKTQHRHDDKKMSEEKKMREAGIKLNGLLNDMWRVMQRRRKMRNVCYEELPWRCHMNLISAECHFQLCVNAFDTVAKQHGCDPKSMASLMDVNWFTLSTSGVLIVSWAGCMKTCEKSLEKTVDIGGATLEHSKQEVHIVASPSKQSISVKVDKKQSSILKQQSSHRIDGAHQHHRVEGVGGHRKEDSMKHFLRHLEQTYQHYQQALVLSHRGTNWVLLQETCNKLLVTTQTLMVKVMTLNSTIDTTTYNVPYTLHQLRTCVYRSFHMAAEFLLDCMSDMEQSWIPDNKSGRKGDTFGNLLANQGGSSLSFDSIDCNAYMDYGNVRRVLTFAIEVLFYENKWEKVIGIIMRFNALSNDHYAEALLPILIIAQRYLTERMSGEDSIVNSHPSVIFDEITGVPIDVNLVCGPADTIEVGAHIDPVGHNLYNIPQDGSRFSIVPMTYEASNVKLRQITEKRSTPARMLEHCRKLSLAYLSGKQGTKTIEQKMQRVHSAVSFLATQVRPPINKPTDFNVEMIELIEDIEVHPVDSKFLPVVIASYEESIDLLKQNRSTAGLAVQGMHELGNLMFSRGNTKSAFKWWSSALDNLLGSENCLQTWRSLISEVDADSSIHRFKQFLDICGIWGCLIGGLLAVKIARYVYYAHMDMCRNACQLATTFFNALFCTSLAHPSAYHSYTTYDIGAGKPITKLIPGINLFTDDNRVHCANIMDSVLWLCERLVKFRCHLQVQPLLTLGHYLASTICKHMKSIVCVKLLRVQSLSSLRMFAAAVEYFSQIIGGTDIAQISETMKAKLKPKLKFSDNAILYEQNNCSVLMDLSNVTLTDTHTNIYGKKLCQEILYMHAFMLVSMAQVIYEIPTSIVKSNIEKVASEEKVTGVSTNKKSRSMDDHNEDKSQLKHHHPRSIEPNAADATSATNADTTEKKLQSEQTKVNSEDTGGSRSEDGPENLKGNLLYAAEQILQKLSEKCRFVDEDEDERNVYLKCSILLSQIDYEKMLALSAASRIYECLKVMSETGPLLTGGVDSGAPFNSSTSSRQSTGISRWLWCKELLCCYMLEVSSSMATAVSVAPSPESMLWKLESVEDCISDAISDCQIFNDERALFLFTFMNIEVDVKKGKNADLIQQNLAKLNGQLEQLTEKSHHVRCIILDAKRLLADLRCLKEAKVEESSGHYKDVEVAILNELCRLGYPINMETLFPVSETMNSNAAPLEGLISSKLSRYRSIALMMGKEEAGVPVDDWKQLLVEVQGIIEFTNHVSMKLPLIEMEILLLYGQIQRRLVALNACTVSACVNTFLTVITMSSSLTCDMMTLRQCYLEIVLAILAKPNVRIDDEFRKVVHVSNTPITPDMPLKKNRSSQGNIKVQQQSGSRKLVASEKAALKEVNRIGKVMWICIRAASILAHMQHKMELLPAEMDTENNSKENKGMTPLPRYTVEDILGATSAEQKKLSNSCLDISSTKLLNYSTHLRRACSYSSHLIGDTNLSVVRIPRKCHLSAVKLREVCLYLTNNSEVYQNNCITRFPVDVIAAAFQSTTRSDTTINTNVESSDTMDSILNSSFSAPGNMSSLIIDSNSTGIVNQSRIHAFTARTNQNPAPKNAAALLLDPEKAKEFEIALQWYRGELEVESEGKIHLLVALNNKNILTKKSSAQHAQQTFVRDFIVEKKEFLALHQNIRSWIECEEAALALQEQPLMVPPSDSPSRSPNTKVKSTTSPTKVANQNSKTLALKKIDKEEELKKELSSLALSFNHLLLDQVHTCDVDVEVTFEATLPNIYLLDRWLNPAHSGHIARTTDALFYWLMNVLGISLPST